MVYIYAVLDTLWFFFSSRSLASHKKIVRMRYLILLLCIATDGPNGFAATNPAAVHDSNGDNNNTTHHPHIFFSCRTSSFVNHPTRMCMRCRRRLSTARVYKGYFATPRAPLSCPTLKTTLQAVTEVYSR